MKVEDAVLLFYLPALPFSSMYSKIIIYSVLLQISSGHIQFAFGIAVLFIFFKLRVFMMILTG